ncbi:MAG: Unknown protein [uncultured Sulfurovum sp.]|uniref:Thioredoxin-like fold domain-containing protein n=1 Tax=uncultured Sulfurovum sp. TaxID=269237 RepID=A0A6S6S9Y5_9BACT|nr:MAG: Unknown protein [uncultured Sulfurovum sp.]
MIKSLLFTILSTSIIYAQSFYVLTGVDSYDPIVANMSMQIDKRHDKVLKETLLTTSAELGINVKGNPSRVLGLMLTDFSLGDTKAVRVELGLGEYVKREGSKGKVFAMTYVDAKRIIPAKDVEDLEEQLVDASEEMLQRFLLQHKEDNKKISNSKNVVEHEDFATHMKYETNYTTALAKAKKMGKPLMVFMTTNFCPWCRKLENRILSKADINAKIQEKYTPVMLNLNSDKFPEQLAKTRYTPILYVLDSNDETIKHQFTGYNNREGFLHLLK